MAAGVGLAPRTAVAVAGDTADTVACIAYQKRVVARQTDATGVAARAQD